eukprot:15082318-Alexandrium_andersonii.AAC.1
MAVQSFGSRAVCTGVHRRRQSHPFSSFGVLRRNKHRRSSSRGVAAMPAVRSARAALAQGRHLDFLS